MPKAVLITSHFWDSKRKAGFHNIAVSLMKKNYEILFLTGNASYIHDLKGDYRAELIKKSPLNKMLRDSELLNRFIRFTFLHPVNYRSGILNRIFFRSVKKYKNALEGFPDLDEFIKNSELFIFESFPGLLWIDHFKKLNKNAKFVYRVSDDMRQLKKHPYIIAHEKKIIDMFDLVSVPSDYFTDVLPFENVKVHNHGIDKMIFDNSAVNPYGHKEKFKFVFTGNAYLDLNFLDSASQMFPEDEFFILGPFKDNIKKQNVHFTGELDFRDTVPYIKFADAGLHTLEYTPGAESFSDSLKVIQYSYCRLPVIAPDFIRSKRNNFIYYKPGNKDSIKQAVLSSKSFDKNIISVDGILSWDELTGKIICE